jgi:hypothetical protein
VSPSRNKMSPGLNSRPNLRKRVSSPAIGVAPRPADARRVPVRPKSLSARGEKIKVAAGAGCDSRALVN